MFKKEIRIIAWDDCAFRFGQKSVRIVGAVFRGGEFIDGLLSVMIKKDGSDATERISSAVLNSRHYDQLSWIMTNGISFGGLNIIDIGAMHRRTGLPVIAVMRKMPGMKQFTGALGKFSDAKERISAVKKAGAVTKCGEIYYQKAGAPKKECEEILKLTCTRSKIPEPLRVAHLIASGLSRRAAKKDKNGSAGYESRGRA